MVQVPVIRRAEVSAEGAQTPEWFMIEMQGELVTDNDKQLAGQDIGTLHIGIPSAGLQAGAQKSEKAVLMIGNYALTGDILSLPKPMIVLQKRKTTNGNGDEGFELEMQAIIRRKALFKERPRHITLQPSAL